MRLTMGLVYFLAIFALAPVSVHFLKLCCQNNCLPGDTVSSDLSIKILSAKLEWLTSSLKGETDDR